MVTIDPEEHYEWKMKMAEEVDELGGILTVHAAGEWGRAAEEGIIEKVRDNIEDEDLRIAIIEQVVNYRFAKWWKEQHDRLEREHQIRLEENR